MLVVYSPLTIANEFIQRSLPVGLEHLKIQKLVFSFYGWWLAFDDDPILYEAPVAGPYGPYFPELLAVLRDKGRRPLTGPVQTPGSTETPPLEEEDVEIIRLVDWIWKLYGACSAEVMAGLLHRKGAPWHSYLVSGGDEVIETEIPHGRIKEYYENLSALCPPSPHR